MASRIHATISRPVLAAAIVLLSGLLLTNANSQEAGAANPQVLRVGFLAADASTAAATRMEPFRTYLSNRIGLDVELVPAATYGALIDATIDGRVQYGIHSATSFAVADEACDCIEPLALPAAFDGSTGFYSVLVALANGPIRSIGDARGTRLAASSDDSLAGWLLPQKELADAGIDLKTHFSGIVSVPGPEAAVTAMLSGNADVAVAWTSLAGDPATGYSFGLLNRLVIDGRLPAGAVRVIWQSSLIPFGPHAVRNDLPAALRQQLADALVDMAFAAPDVLEVVDRSGFGGGGFVAVDESAYDPLESLLATQ
jgi:phosphonate transport system substrate-binding protein